MAVSSTYLLLLMIADAPGAMLRSHWNAQLTSPGPVKPVISLRVSVFKSFNLLRVLGKKPTSAWLAPGVWTLS